jgi:hypothetical protein
LATSKLKISSDMTIAAAQSQFVSGRSCLVVTERLFLLSASTCSSWSIDLIKEVQGAAICGKQIGFYIFLQI